LRAWQVYLGEIRHSYEVLKSHRRRLGRFNALLTRGMKAALERSRPHVIVAGGYNYLATWQAQRWARHKAVPFLLWSESNLDDSRRRFPWVEAAKRRFILGCQGYVVPGASAAAYLGTFGVHRENIHLAPNAVDVTRFSQAADAARRDPGLRTRLSLPERYLLFVGRFVEAKGVFDLLAAYAKLPPEVRSVVGLVMAGGGEAKDELVRKGRDIKPGSIAFPGFLDRDKLAPLYALAEGLVLPTHSDTWGLVVNEAMACALPAIVSRVAGCVSDMMQDGRNGFVVEPRSPEALTAAMQKLLADSGPREQMRDACRETSARFTPELWAKGMAEALSGVVGGGIE